MMGVTLGALAGSEGLEPFGAVPLTLGERSPLREETYESDIWGMKNKEKVEKREGKVKEKKKLLLSGRGRLEGGKKRAMRDVGFVCLCLS
jgi:hypothetical protein